MPEAGRLARTKGRRRYEIRRDRGGFVRQARNRGAGYWTAVEKNPSHGESFSIRWDVYKS